MTIDQSDTLKKSAQTALVLGEKNTGDVKAITKHAVSCEETNFHVKSYKILDEYFSEKEYYLVIMQHATKTKCRI